MQVRSILIVDDEVNVLNTLKRLLRNEDYDVVVANSGAEGLEILVKRKVQLVISDYRMPGMLGTEFLEEVRRLYPHIMRVMLTGYSDPSVVESPEVNSDLCRVITKPWNDVELKELIRSCLAELGSGNQARDVNSDRN